MTDQEEDLRAAWLRLIHLRWYETALDFHPSNLDPEEKAGYRCRRWGFLTSFEEFEGITAHGRRKIYAAFRRAWASRHLKEASA